MTRPVEITDPQVVKAYAHPLRIEILARLENRVASPRELAAELGVGLPKLSYHVRQLGALGLIKLVRRRMKRGAVEHYYTATVRPTITDAGWSETPEIVKRALVGARIAQAGKEVARAAEKGGFARDDIHISRTHLRLTERGWAAVSREFARALARVDRIAAGDASEVERHPGAEIVEATAIMMLFELPTGVARPGVSAARQASQDDAARCPRRRATVTRRGRN